MAKKLKGRDSLVRIWSSAEKVPVPLLTLLHVLPTCSARQVEKEEELRFGRLVEAFSDADSSGLALVTDLIVFFNTLLSAAYEFEDRVHLRTEMITAGILEAMERIRDYYNLLPKVPCSER